MTFEYDTEIYTRPNETYEPPTEYLDDISCILHSCHSAPLNLIHFQHEQKKTLVNETRLHNESKISTNEMWLNRTEIEKMCLAHAWRLLPLLHLKYLTSSSGSLVGLSFRSPSDLESWDSGDFVIELCFDLPCVDDVFDAWSLKRSTLYYFASQESVLRFFLNILFNYEQY